MKALNWENITDTSIRWTIDGVTLYAWAFNKAKKEDHSGAVNLMREELGFSKHDAIYDVAMNSFCELGYSDIDHEEMLVRIELLFERDLLLDEVKTYIEALTDYQGG